MNTMSVCLLSVVFRIWARTLRFTLHGLDHLSQAKGSDNRVVGVIWHDELFPLACLHRDEGHIVAISQSRDGEFAAQLAHRLGFVVTRGSSTRGGVRAVMSSLREMKRRGAAVVLTADGPRGPRHEIKDGALYIAWKIQAKILPVRITMHRAKVFNRSWDRFQLPLPFSRCDVYYGEPLILPENLSRDGFGAEREKLQAAMDALGKK